MNGLARKTIGAFKAVCGRISSDSEKKHRSFKEMIQWRREKEQKERLFRNKVLYLTLLTPDYIYQFLEINGYLETRH